MRKRLFIILSLLITTCGFAMAQALIRGSVVSDSDGSPVIGATIVVDGTSKGTVTNGDGKFSITLPAGKKNVRISYIGFEPQTVAAKDGMKVKLLEAKNELAETIITGYGNFKKASFTGSAQSLKTDAMQDVPVISIADKLSGGVAGVSISQTSGAPGGTKSIRIRGMSSINAGNDPLIVVDGTPVQSGDANPFSGSYNDTGSDLLSTINPNDIESMTVIKDAAAASLYGSRAANGVIVITTKSGKAGKTKLSFRSDWGFSNMAINYRPTLGGDDRRALLSKGLENQAIYDLGMSAADAKAYADSKIDAYASMPKSGWTDWKDLLFRTGSHQNYQMSVTGGNTDTKFYASLAYNKQLGIAYDQGLERITGNANLQHSFGRFDLQVTTQLSRTRQDLANESTSFTSPIMNYAWVQNPSSTPYNDDGTLNDGCGLFGVNPIFERDHSSDVYTFTKAFSTVKLTYNIWDNLKLSEKALTRLTSQYQDYEKNDEAWYHLFLLYSRLGNKAMADNCLERLKADFPNSNWTTLLSDPYFAENAKFGVHIEDSIYAATYEAFKADRFGEVKANAKISAERFPLGANRPKFIFIEGLGMLNEGDADACVANMKKVVEEYPKSEVAEMAGMIIKGVQAGRALHGGKFDIGDIWSRRGVTLAETDSTANDTLSTERFTGFVFLLAYQPDSVDANQLLYDMAKYNFSNFLVRNFDIAVDQDNGICRLMISGFLSYDEALQYARHLYADPAMAAKVKGCRRIIISQENLKLLGTKYSYNEYEKFFEDALAPISISKEQLLNMPESVEQEKEPESDSAEGQQQEDIINNNEPQYDGGFDFGDDFYQ